MALGITVFLMFTGQAEEAMQFYVGLFPNSKVVAVERYGRDQAGPEGTIKKAEFILCGQRFMCIDSPITHDFGFTPAISLFVECKDEEEFQRYYDALVRDGKVLMPVGDYGFSRKFAWVNDRFGVSWQLNMR